MTTLPLNQINTTPAELARVRPCQDTLTRYIELMQAGEQLPPVTVFHDGEVYWLADGRHRLEARKRLGYADIQMEVRPGTERDAQLHAFGANVCHGLVSTTCDRKRVAERLLQDDEWKEFPNRKLGELCGLSHTTIGKMRNSLESVSKNSTPSQPVSLTPSKKGVSTSTHSESETADEPFQESYDPTEDELKEMVQLVAQLTEDNERLREQIALGNLSIPEDERINIDDQLEDLHKRVNLAEMEVDSLKIGRDIQMSERSALLKQVKNLQYVLKKKDKEITGLRDELDKAINKVSLLEVELEFEKVTR